MGMCSYVVGIKTRDEKFNAMKSIWNQCIFYKIPIPKEVEEYFNDMTPDPNGVVVYIPHKDWADPDPNNPRNGIEINVSDIPEDVKVIRFINSW
ncbi:MAG: hypothetical protein C5B43_00655 [Verrucomicrobia bacterium]|nr:MAG: hypothetical protein C5B43_00655 [Verrucomicrobiota bacterium]